MAGTDLTKAQFARELGVSRARVSQYVAAGMPLQSDGKVNRAAATAWITRTVDPTRVRDRGAARAAQAGREPDLARGPHSKAPPGFGAVERVENAFDQGCLFATLSLGYESRCVGSLALALGASLPVAWSLSETLPIALMEIAEERMRAAGIEPWASDPDPSIYEEEAFAQFDWAALAAARGQPYDLEAWREYGRRHLSDDAGDDGSD